LEALTPLERDDVPGTHDSSLLPSEGASLLETGNPGVTLLAWKRAEDGDGTILRLQDTAGEASNIGIHSPFLKFERAWLCNLLEDNVGEITIQGEELSVPIKPFQVLTLRVHTTPRIRQGGAQ
jgi:alpha-mannosidase